METLAKPNQDNPRLAAHQSVCVWLVEDNHDFRKTVARVLNGIEGVECSQHFSNAEDALDALLGGGVPDVILLDVGLPGQNGIAAVPKIKAILPSTRVVMLTVFDDDEKVFKAICAGASGYLLKSTPPGVIAQAIREALAGGAPMTPKVAGAVLQMFSKMSRPTQDYGLTEREEKILELMMEGLTAKAIAGNLAVSYHTVDTHIRNIYTKLHVHSRGGAVAKGFKGKLF